jgi:hypothetical protein
VRAIQQRMANEGRVHAVFAQKRGFEWQDHRRARHRPRESRHPSGARGPHLRRDEVEDGHAFRRRQLGDPHVEAGIVHQDDERHVAASQSTVQRAP